MSLSFKYLSICLSIGLISLSSLAWSQDRGIQKIVTYNECEAYVDLEFLYFRSSTHGACGAPLARHRKGYSGSGNFFYINGEKAAELGTSSSLGGIRFSDSDCGNNASVRVKALNGYSVEKVSNRKAGGSCIGGFGAVNCKAFFATMRIGLKKSNFGQTLIFKMDGDFGGSFNETFNKTQSIVNFPEPVGLTTTADCGRVKLKWSKPAKQCDDSKIQIRRDGGYIAEVAVTDDTYFNKIGYSSTGYNYAIRLRFAGRSGNMYSGWITANGNPIKPVTEPSNLRLVQEGCASEEFGIAARLDWDMNALERPKEYTIYRSTDVGFTSPESYKINDGNRRYFIDSQSIWGQLAFDTDYYYRVEVKDDCDNVEISDVQTIRIDGKPDKAESVSSVLNPDESVTLSWTHNGEKIKEFDIRRDGVAIGTVDLDQRQFVDNNLQNCEIYNYEIVAVSNCFSAVLSESSELLVQTNNNLNSFSRITASKGYHSDRIKVAWTYTGVDPVDQFVIYRQPLSVSNTFQEVARISYPAEVWDDTDIISGELYEYAIVGLDCDFDGSFRPDFNLASKAIGFKSQYGLINGRVSYKGGNAVEGVKVTVTPSDEIVRGVGVDLTAQKLAIPLRDQTGTSWFPTNEWTLGFWAKPKSNSDGQHIWTAENGSDLITLSITPESDEQVKEYSYSTETIEVPYNQELIGMLNPFDSVLKSLKDVSILGRLNADKSFRKLTKNEIKGLVDENKIYQLDGETIAYLIGEGTSYDTLYASEITTLFGPVPDVVYGYYSQDTIYQTDAAEIAIAIIDGSNVFEARHFSINYDYGETYGYVKEDTLFYKEDPSYYGIIKNDTVYDQSGAVYHLMKNDNLFYAKTELNGKSSRGNRFARVVSTSNPSVDSVYYLVRSVSTGVSKGRKIGLIDSEKEYIFETTSPGLVQYIIDDDGKASFAVYKDQEATIKGLPKYLVENSTGIVYDYNNSSDIYGVISEEVLYNVNVSTGFYHENVTSLSGSYIFDQDGKYHYYIGDQDEFGEYSVYNVIVEEEERLVKQEIGSTIKSRFNLSLVLNTDTLLRASEIHTNEFSHIAISYENGAMRLYLNGELQDEGSRDISSITTGLDEMVFGNHTFSGILDEVTLWSDARSDENLKRDYGRFLEGSENNLIGYWRLSENIGNNAYDAAYDPALGVGQGYYEHHGRISQSDIWTNDVPGFEVLSYSTYSNQDGNYSVPSIIFNGTGQNFQVTPLFGKHKFNPSKKLVFIGSGAQIHNDIDFEDQSSFTVTGTVKYDPLLLGYTDRQDINAPSCFVEGAQVMVDDQPVLVGGQVVTTDKYGAFEIEVPIGAHTISLSKPKHEFSVGQWPPVGTHNFVDDVIGLSFYDSTLRTVIGKVVGGNIEGNKFPGFDSTVNNIGQARIVFQSLGRECIRDTVYTDSVSGEFKVDLLPLNYRIADLKVPEADAAFNRELRRLTEGTLNLSPDTIKLKQKTEEEAYVGGDPMRKIEYHRIKNFIYKKPSEIFVLSSNVADPEIFGETEIRVNNPSDPDLDLVLNLADANLQFPVFTNTRSAGYNWKVKVAEQYKNFDNDQVYDYDIKEGELLIDNEISGVNNRIDLSLVTHDTEGYFNYTFVTGIPNISFNRRDPNLSYTKTVEMYGPEKSSWRPEGEIFRAYVLGAKIEAQSDFYTVSNQDNPYQMVDVILRDPPGSNSYAYLDEGTKFTQTTQVKISNKDKFKEMISFGFKFKNLVYLSFLNELKNTISLSASQTSSYGLSKSNTKELEVRRKLTTSAEPRNSGADSDLFIGKGINITTPQTIEIDFIENSECKGNCLGDQISAGGYNFRLGKDKGFTLAIEEHFETEFVYTKIQIEQEIKALEKVVANVDPNEDEYDRLVNQIGIWKKVLGYNEAKKLIARANQTPENTKGHSIGFGSKVEESYTLTSENIGSNNYSLAFSLGLKLQVKSSVFGGFSKFEVSWEHLTTSNRLETTSETEDKTFGYVLEDKDIGDKLDIRMILNGQSGLDINLDNSELWADYYEYTYNKWTNKYIWSEIQDQDIYTDEGFFETYFFDPVFYLAGGRTSCPHEEEIKTEHLQFLDDTETLNELSSNSIDPTVEHSLSSGTYQRDQPGFRIEPRVLRDVPSDQRAIFNVIFENYNTEDTVRFYKIQLDQRTNQNGATMRLDGERFIKGGTPIPMFGGDQLEKKVTLRPIRGVYDYEDIVIYFHSECQFDFGADLNFQKDIYAVDTISVYFTPTCPRAEVIQPSGNWIINKASGNTLQAEILENNFHFENHQKIKLQYKASYQTDQEWTDIEIWTRDATEQIENGWLKFPEGNNYIVYDWNIDTFDLTDGQYDLRWYFICQDGTESQSAITSGTVDRTSPHPFGRPQPADGILSPNDEISIKFNEPIEQGLVSPDNIAVKGKRNGNTLDHQISLSFTGSDAEGAVIQGLRLADNPFTMEAWVNWSGATLGEQVILHHGKESGTNVYLNIDQSGYLVFHMNEQSLKADEPLPVNDWTHIAFSFDPEADKLALFVNAKIMALSTQFTEIHLGEGLLEIGKAENSSYSPFRGFMHELRVWRKFRRDVDLSTNFYKELVGREIGLVGYWMFNEGEGDLAEDRVQGRNAQLYSNWSLKPDTYGVELNSGGYIELPGNIAFNADTDFTIEFWFKGNKPLSESTLLSNGDGEGNNSQATDWVISVNTLGQIRVKNDGEEFNAVDSSFFNNQWHHFALVVNRTANISAYLDGELQNSISSENLKGFGGPKLWLGARGVVSETGSVSVDNSFDGTIDEVRIWELARSQAQIDRDKRTRLDGDEIGLSLYLPFEKYDDLLRIVQPSLHDLKTDSEVVGNIMGNAQFTQLTAAIKSKPYITPIEFDYSVNGDQILISLDDSDLSRIENVILDITVMNIRDKNGNKMESPATWTAYVDRNQVFWADRSFDLKKKTGDPFTFEATIKNDGGQEEDFTIHDFPLWLEVEPSTGTIAPNSELKVTFTVNPGLNIGNYNELIYLQATNGFDEILVLDLKVYQEAPEDWQIDPANFKYSMSFIGQLKIDGLFSLDESDILAAFVNDTIRGLVKPEYIDEYDKYVTFLNVYSNELGGEDITFRIWDASEGKVHIYPDLVNPNMETKNTVAFQADKILGQLTNPIIFTTTNNILKELPLPKGWKWVTFNLRSEALKRSSQLFSTTDNVEGDLIMSQPGNYDSYDAAGNVWIGNLAGDNLAEPEGFQHEASYRIFNQGGQMLKYWGQEVDPSSISIELQEGIWNWIGFPGNRNMDVNEALVSLNPEDGDIIKSQYQFAIYDPALHWIGSLKNMQPDEGYMIKTNKATLTFPKAGLINGRTFGRTEELQIPASWNNDIHQYNSTMSVIAEVTGIDIADGHILGAFINAQCHGLAQPIFLKDKVLFFITIAADEDRSIEFLLHREGDELIALKGTVAYQSDRLMGTLEKPIQLVAKISDDDINISPNPFDNEIAIRINNIVSSTVEISISDMLGKPVVNTIFNTTSDSEVFNIVFDKSNAISSGIYRISIRNGDKLTSRLIIKK